jgi:hypothetical protein
MPIWNRWIGGLIPNLIEKSWTLSMLAVIPSLTAVHQMVDFLPR